MFSLVRRRPRLALSLALLGVTAVGFAVYWFEPHKLFFDQRAADGPPTTAEVIAKGELRGLEHETSGRVELARLPDGRHVLRFVDLKTSNGPKLRVYLSTIAAQPDWFVYDDGPHLDLGDLKGNLGSSNYDVPAGTDLTKYVSAVVWCQRFSVGFGVAPLEPTTLPSQGEHR